MSNNPSTIASLVPTPVKHLAILSAALLTAACASPQKVDRIHSSIYHQQATLQQLETDMQQIEQQRQQVESQLQQLEADSGAREEQIQQTRRQLVELDSRQSEVSRVMKQMNNSVASNTRSISSLQSKEEKRRAIIKAQQERWQQITAQANTKLAEIDQPPLDANPEAIGGGSDNVRP